MTLALRLNRTLHELKTTLTASELRMWIEYDAVNPLSDRRGDIQAAQIATAIFNSQGAKVKLDEMLIQWGQSEVADRGDGLEEFFAAMAG